MICSASDFSSSGLSGALSSANSSPFTRIVAGRPTFSSRSDALRWTMSVIAALKLKVGWPPWGASGMGIDSEKGLSELAGVVGEGLVESYQTVEFGQALFHVLR